MVHNWPRREIQPAPCVQPPHSDHRPTAVKSHATKTVLPQATGPLLGQCLEGIRESVDLGAPLDAWLKTLGPARTQRELARSVFRFLGLLTEDGGQQRLVPDIALWRADPALLAEELTRRVRAGYRSAGCDCADEIGAAYMKEKTLRRILEHEPPFQREKKGTRDNLVRTAVHFHKLICEERPPDEDGGIAAPQQPDGPSPSSQDATAAASTASPAPWDSPSAEPPLFHQQGTVLAFEFRLQQTRSSNGGAVTAQVHIHSPDGADAAAAQQVAWLEALAARLLDEADRIEAARPR